MLWKKAEEFFLLGFSQNHIDMAVLENNTPQWRRMGFYGHPDRSQRGVTWDLLRMLSTTLDLPWCVIGDFNDICNNEEKRGTIPHPPQLIRNFYEALHDCQLQDIPLQGYPFTWERRNGSRKDLTELWRLQHGLANSQTLSYSTSQQLVQITAQLHST